MKLNTWILFVALVFTAVSCTPARQVEYVTPMVMAPTATPSVKIFIDPGHGGKDEGAKSTSGPKSFEKSYNLQTALHLEKYLRDAGYETVVTRGDDTFVPLKIRSAFANGNQADLFVSVHYNASESPKAEGIEVYYFASGDKREQKSKMLAQSVFNRLLANTKSKGRGVKAGNLAVLRETKMPAILVEGGFMTNANELNKIKDPEYMKKVAQSIAQGVKDFLGNREEVKTVETKGPQGPKGPNLSNKYKL
jgi:N-acetylmuramoyl-L-alanine amidase